MPRKDAPANPWWAGLIAHNRESLRDLSLVLDDEPEVCYMLLYASQNPIHIMFARLMPSIIPLPCLRNMSHQERVNFHRLYPTHRWSPVPLTSVSAREMESDDAELSAIYGVRWIGAEFGSSSVVEPFEYTVRCWVERNNTPLRLCASCTCQLFGAGPCKALPAQVLSFHLTRKAFARGGPNDRYQKEGTAKARPHTMATSGRTIPMVQEAEAEQTPEETRTTPSRTAAAPWRQRATCGLSDGVEFEQFGLERIGRCGTGAQGRDA